MKTKTSLLLTVVLVASNMLSGAQTTNTTDEGTNTPVQETNAVTETTNAVIATTNTIVETPDVGAESTSSAETIPLTKVTGGQGADEIVPLITIDDAALPDAITTLARQAGINFQFDPAVLNPPPDATGKIPALPKVSFRWENVTAMDALSAILENNKLQLSKDPKNKIARITKKDAAAQEPLFTKVFQLQYSNPTNLVGLLTNTISPRSKVIGDVRTSQLIVSATEKDLDSVEALIMQLDAKTRQILIEARFLEINKNPRTSKGVDWTDTLQKQNITFGNGVSSGIQTVTTPGSTTTSQTPGSRPLSSTGGSTVSSTLETIIGGNPPGISANTMNGFNPSTFFLNADGVKVALSFLNSDADAESIATPRAVTLENVPTTLAVVRNIPVFEQEQGATTGGTQQANTSKPNYLLAGPNGVILNEIGIKLKVTPRVYGSSNIFLDLFPEISDRELKPEVTVLGGQVNSAPIFSRRTLQTQVIIPSGFTLVLGGLRQDNSTKTFTKVPFFGDLPGIGLAFRKDEKARDKRDLVIFVTPTIIDNGDFQEANNRDFLRQRMEEKPDKEWSAWDSGKPVDWTKPDSTVKQKNTFEEPGQ